MKLRKLLLKVQKSNMIKKILRILFYCAGKLPTHKKAIVFESFLGKQYSDNPKAIYEYMKNNYPDYKMYWNVDRRYKHNFNNENLNCLPRLGFKWIYIMATAKYWVVNSRLPQWVPKPKHTVYIQTWHGTPLKKLGIDINEVHMPGVTTEEYKKEFLNEANKWDYLISPNQYSTSIFKRAFGFNKSVIESGYPRNDVLYTHNNETEINNIKHKLGIPLNKKVILYAPTWRDNEYYDTGQYKFKLQLDLDKLKLKLGDEFVVLLRMHYLVAEKFNLTKYENFVFDYSTFNDINQLYLVSDVLITDYSSVFFDYANLCRPILFFVYDMDNYRDDLRGFYFNMEQNQPGPLLENTDQIICKLKLIAKNEYTIPSSFKDFQQKFCYLEDGHASKRVTEAILGKRDKN